MKNLYLIFAFLFFNQMNSQNLASFEITDDWLAKIEEMVDLKKSFPSLIKKNILIFSLFTGYDHWTVPHTESAIKVIALKTGYFNIQVSKDISVFEEKNISKYDVIVLNNNCSKKERRDLFWDVIKKDISLNEKQVLHKAKKLEDNLMKFVKSGKGLILLHGGIVMQNNSLDFSRMVGGSFDFHPPQQKINVKLVDPNHPMVDCFEGSGFTHFDEPYFFKNAYFDYNFRPLLYMDLNEIKMKEKASNDKIKYISWIKKYGEGRVFYSSPSHNAQSMENPKLVNFLLNGLYYAAGLIEYDDSPISLN